MDEEKDYEEFEDDDLDEVDEDEVEDDEIDEDYEGDSSFLAGYNKGNRFINRIAEKDTDDSGIDNDISNVLKQNSNPNNEVKSSPKKQNPSNASDSSKNQSDSLKNNVQKQAKDNPPKKNSTSTDAKAKSGDSSAAIQMAANKAKNTMNSIHDKNADQNNIPDDQNNFPDNQNNENVSDSKIKEKLDEIKAAGDAVGKEVVSDLLASALGIPKPIADMIAEKYIKREKLKRKIQIIAIVFVIVLVFLLIVGFVGTDDKSASKSKSFFSGSSSAAEFYEALVDAVLIPSGTCEYVDGEVDSSCDYITFLEKIKSNSDDEKQFMYIFYAISYNRDPEDYVNNNEEINDLINNRRNFSTYLKNTYISKYRSDLSENFDLYQYITDIITDSYSESSSGVINYKVCENVILEDSTDSIPFNEYIAGVIKAQMPNAGTEATKAFAITASTYTYFYTDSCNKKIDFEQPYIEIDKNDENDKRILQIVDSVLNIIITDTFNSIVVADYDEFCFSERSTDNDSYYFEQGNITIPKSWVDEKKIEELNSNEYLTKDGETKNIGWLMVNCPCEKTNKDIKNNPLYSNVCVTNSDEYIDGGTGYGLSIYGAMYLEEVEHLDYVAILKRFFGDDINLYKISSEFSINSLTGFKMRIGRAKRDNVYYYSNINAEYLYSLEGECVWYAGGRANEILDEWGKTFNWNLWPNGGQFCSYARSYNYSVNTVVQNISEGSIISWMFDSYGHVAIVERVNRDESGNVVSIEISEGGLGYYNYGVYASNIGSNIINFNGNIYAITGPRDFVNTSTYGGTSAERRKALCEQNGSGCQHYSIIYASGIATYNRASVDDFCTIPLSQFN